MNTRTSQTNSNRKYFLGALTSYFAIIFNIVAALFYTPWMISQLGSSDYALQSLATSIIAVVTIDIGIGRIVSRFISKYRANNDVEGANSFIGIVYKIYLIINGAITLTLFVIFFFLQNIYQGLTPEEIERLRVVYVIIGFYSLIAFQFTPINGVLIGNEKFGINQSINLLTRIINVASVVIFLSIGQGLYAFVLISVLTSLLGIIIKLIYIRKKCKFGSKPKIASWNKDIISTILKMSLWTIIITLSSKAIIGFNQTVLGMFTSTDQIAIFAVALVFEGYSWEFSNALNGMFMPKLSQMETAKQSSADFTNLMTRVGRLQVIFVGFIVVGIISFGRGFINNVWNIDSGISYDMSYFSAIFLLLPTFFTFSNQIATSLYYVRDKVKYLALSRGIAAVITVVLSLTLCYFFSEYGALVVSISFCIGKIIGHVAVDYYLQYIILKLDIRKFLIECLLKLAPFIVITTTAGISIEYLFPTTGLTGFLFKVIILTLFYLVISYSFMLNNFEKQLIISIVQPIKKILYQMNRSDDYSEIIAYMSSKAKYYAKYRQDLLYFENKSNRRLFVINEGDRGSTGTIANLVIEQALSNDYVVCFANYYNAHNYQYTYKIYAGKIDYFFNKVMTKFSGGDGFYNHLATYKLLRKIEEFKPTIIHLHNLHGHYLNIELLFKYLKQLQIPIIWTLQDCWSFTGRCAHFAFNNCYKWTNQCYKCEFKREYPRAYIFDKCKEMYEIKKSLFTAPNNLRVVAPCNWLEKMLKKSFFSENSISVINNGIVLHPPISKEKIQALKIKLGISNEKIFVSAANPWSSFKGYKYIQEAAKRCQNRNYIFLVIGKGDKIERVDNIITIPIIKSREEMNLYYSCGDAFLNTTLQDTFPTVNIESISNGTPVITFDTGGSAEIIDEKSGIVVPQKDMDSLIDALDRIKKTPEVIENCMKRSLRYDNRIMAKSYIELFESTINSKSVDRLFEIYELSI